MTFWLNGVKVEGITGYNSSNNHTDTSAVTANKDGSIVERLEFVQTVLGQIGSIDWNKGDTPAVDEDGGRAHFTVGVVDRDTGLVASANINIAAATISLKKSTGGAAFSTVGITQPTLSKTTGQVFSDYDFNAAEWQVGDAFLLEVSGATATDANGNTSYMPVMDWLGIINEDLDVKTEVDDLYTNRVGATNDAASRTGSANAKLADLLRITAPIESATTSAGTAFVVNDSGRTEASGYWVGAILEFLTGVNAGIARVVTTFTNASGFVVDPALPNASGNGDAYVIRGFLGSAATANGTEVGTSNGVIGNKGDAASTAGTASIVALIRALIAVYASQTGTATGGSTTTLIDTVNLTQADADYWKGMMLVLISGSAAGQARPVTAFNAGTNTLTVTPAFTQAVANGVKYAIVSYYDFVAIQASLANVAPATNSLADQLYIGAAEQLRNFIAKTGGTAIAASKSLSDAIGNIGDAPIPAADNATVAGSSSLQATLGRKDDTTLGLSAAATATETMMRYLKAAFDRTRMPSVADNVVAAASASIGETTGRKDDAATNTIGSTATLVGYIKGLINRLNQGSITGTGTVTAAGTTTEQTIIDQATPIGHSQIYMDLNALTQNATIKVYRKIDNATYRLLRAYAFTFGSSAVGWYSDQHMTRNGFKVTITMGTTEGADRSVPYEMLTQLGG